MENIFRISINANEGIIRISPTYFFNGVFYSKHLNIFIIDPDGYLIRKIYTCSTFL
ncbi:hypothetical protein Cassandra_0209 [Pseudomonas phage Cassandra]|uniref:Uncharacterized protein n=1 Tax=Pseudomonas phage vB_PaeM_PA5oct TaxID=2163605 RepID=A0A4Y5JWA0_9CAUD|nr:hypothetical protein PQE65_gp084 [Pseudomonas phage vB_PaeM_PA5oct]WPK38885.1 hypothetical protein Cassandra_0209 [Pseudomonas phage Cassandra]WPK39405.1 hypothetical protein Deiofobo_0208 [Pseudomonas phage Deifobo]WPK39918.1 hypothetical protein ETTORE_0209 [Pseudomonas phage Ettore]WPK40438.1 hypothetical protein Paride_0208 [Pseudomonas phage Paride]BDR25653.1 hypothetical protein RVBP16_0930 [Pseudomonas phage sp. 30-2]